jgi:hypothetical protein
MATPSGKTASKKPMPSMNTPPAKKHKVDIFNQPGTVELAICASQSASGKNSEFPLTIKESYCSSELFFFEDADASVTVPEIGKELKSALKVANMKEEMLRNAIYRELKLRNGVQFPRVNAIKESHEYQEADLGNLLLELYPYMLSQREDQESNPSMSEGGEEDDNQELKQYKSQSGEEDEEEKQEEEEIKKEDEGEEYEKEERILKGLPVTTTSRPDLAVLRDNTFLFGECKNNTSYTIDHASNQCTLYLCTLLYFFRVRMGKPVESVFGFFVCGCGCSDLDGRYAIGLIKLSAPRLLGSQMLCQKFCGTYPTDNMKGMELLVNFLKNGKTVEFHKLAEKDQDEQHRIPALFSLPVELWNDPCLVRNGTSSIVFRCSKKDVTRLLHQFPDLHKEWETFRAKVNRFLRFRKNRHFYLKIRFVNFSLQSKTFNPVVALKSNGPSQYKKVYCVKPFSAPPFLEVNLMEDCGTSLTASTLILIGFKRFCIIFRDFWKKTILLCSVIFHGDVLPHNIVFTNNKKLMLVDCDEGTVEQPVCKRVIDNRKNAKYPFLRYPNFLRVWENAELYTQIQMLATFLEILELFTVEDPVVAKNVKILQEQALETNNYLSQNNNKTPSMFNFATEDDWNVLVNSITTLKNIIGVK